MYQNADTKIGFCDVIYNSIKSRMIWNNLAKFTWKYFKIEKFNSLKFSLGFVTSETSTNEAKRNAGVGKNRIYKTKHWLIETTLFYTCYVTLIYQYINLTFVWIWSILLFCYSEKGKEETTRQADE